MIRAAGTFKVKMRPEMLSDVAANSAIMGMSIDIIIEGGKHSYAFDYSQ